MSVDELREKLSTLGQLNLPATAEQIEMAQIQTNCIFPDEYKIFLECTNGIAVNSNFGLYLCATQDLEQLNTSYEITIYYPALLLIGFTPNCGIFIDHVGVGGVYVIDLEELEPGSGSIIANSFFEWILDKSCDVGEVNEIPLAPVPTFGDLYLVKIPIEGKKALVKLKNLLSLPQSISEVANLSQNDLPYRVLSNIRIEDYGRLCRTYNQNDIYLIFTYIAQPENPIVFSTPPPPTETDSMPEQVIVQNQNLLEAKAKERAIKKSHSSFITNVKISPNTKSVVTVSMDATARVWDVETGENKIVFAGHADFIDSVVFFLIQTMF
jgi:hypothetical protein